MAEDSRGRGTGKCGTGRIGDGIEGQNGGYGPLHIPAEAPESSAPGFAPLDHGFHMPLRNRIEHGLKKGTYGRYQNGTTNGKDQL